MCFVFIYHAALAPDKQARLTCIICQTILPFAFALALPLLLFAHCSYLASFFFFRCQTNDLSSYFRVFYPFYFIAYSFAYSLTPVQHNGFIEILHESEFSVGFWQSKFSTSPENRSFGFDAWLNDRNICRRNIWSVVGMFCNTR